MEWILGVEPWSEILSGTENSIAVVKFISGGGGGANVRHYKNV